MGDTESKPKGAPAPPPPDMNEILIGMKMKSKMFTRSAQKSLKEKGQYYAKAKKQMQSGQEEGARMYQELAQQKDNENKQFMRMGIRLETLQCQIRSKQNSVDMVHNLDGITPILQMQSTDMPIEQMYGKLERFNQSFDDLHIKGAILDEGLEKTMGQPNQTKNVDNMMQGLVAEVQMEQGYNPNINIEKNQNLQQENTNANNDFYADQKNA